MHQPTNAHAGECRPFSLTYLDTCASYFVCTVYVFAICDKSTSNNCYNPQQMYIQPPGVPFSGAQGVSQPLMPPPSMQYFPPVSIPSTLPQVRYKGF